MQFIVRRTIARQILVAFSFFVLLCAGLTALTVRELRHASARTHNLVFRDARALQLVQALQESFTRIDQVNYAMLSESSSLNELESKLRSEDKEIDEDFADLNAYLGVDNPTIASLMSTHKNFYVAEYKISQLVKKGMIREATITTAKPTIHYSKLVKFCLTI